MCCECCSVTQRKIWVFGCAAFILLIAIILGVLWPTLALKILHSQLVLKEGSMNYENWIETPIPMYLEVTLFNWTNPDKLTEKDYKPNFVEVGPFVFHESHKRVNITWNKNSTVTFDQIRTWHFDEKLSNGSLLEPVTTANVITATVASKMKDANAMVKKVVNYMLENKGGSLLWTKPAGEWIFDGFDDQLLKFLRKFNSTAFDIPFEKFGWLVDRNLSSTYDGRFTMKTGEDVIENLGYMTLWRGADRTPYNDGYCGMVNGTTGELWPPGLDSAKPVTIFATDICRSVDLTPVGKYTKHGVQGYIWKADNRTFDNGENYEDMKCYCPRTGECPKYGVVSISECRFGAPVYVSYPHFYMADPSYLNAVTGLKPTKEKHEFTLSLETNTGIPLDVNARLQINMMLSKIDGIKMYKDVQKDMMIPMFWFRQSAELNEEYADKAKLALALPDIGVYTAYGLGSLGLIILIIGVILCLTKRWKSRVYDDQEPLSN